MARLLHLEPRVLARRSSRRHRQEVRSASHRFRYPALPKRPIHRPQLPTTRAPRRRSRPTRHYPVADN